MGCIIGNARCSEYNSIQGQKGDQTKREVMTQPWNTGGSWSWVIRPINVEAANKIAQAMENACANDNIGYNQYDRTSLYTEWKRTGKIKTVGKCNTDCSALVAVCCNSAGLTGVSKDMYTGNELAILKGTGQFYVYTASKYTKSESLLARGDILLRPGHTAIVVEGNVERLGRHKAKMLRKHGIREHAKLTSKKLGYIPEGKVYTISKISRNGRWGKLANRTGWIRLKDTEKV